MSKQAPTIAAIIPTYNRASTVRRAIESVLAQTHPLDEILVVDDGGTDTTKEVVEAYGHPVRYVRRENGGLAAARNTGVANARSEWVAFLDDDDEWLPEKIERQIAEVTKAPAVDLCYSGLLLRRAAGDEVFRRSIPPNRLWPGIRLKNPFSPCTVMMRRTAFTAVGGFDESLRCVEDWEFHLRAIVGRQVAMCDAPLTRVYEAPTSMSGQFMNMLNVELSIVDKLLVGLNGPARYFWRRRILSRIYDRAAVTARAAGFSPWSWLTRSLLYWPLPDVAPYRYHILLVEVMAAVRGNARARVVSNQDAA